MEVQRTVLLVSVCMVGIAVCMVVCIVVCIAVRIAVSVGAVVRMAGALLLLAVVVMMAMMQDGADQGVASMRVSSPDWLTNYSFFNTTYAFDTSSELILTLIPSNCNDGARYSLRRQVV